jgi:hypothetical protein
MRTLWVTMGGLVFVASFFGAAPARGDDDPEPRQVYYVYHVIITGDKLSAVEMRKMFPTLKLAKVLLQTTDDEYARSVENGQNSRRYLLFVRGRDSSRASFDRVHDVIKGTKGVEGIYVLVDVSKRIVDRLDDPFEKPKK